MCASPTVSDADNEVVGEESSLLSRISENPRPAAIWAGVLLALIALQIGPFLTGTLLLVKTAVVGLTATVQVLLEVLFKIVGQDPAVVTGPIVDAQQAVVGFLSSIQDVTRGLPRVLDRNIIPNEGYQTGPNGPWKGTFLGFQPAVAWAIRVAAVYLYTAFVIYWLFRGYLVFREHYRYADWTPRDDVIDRLRGHRWGQFGMVVVFMFLTMAIFAPTLGPSTHNQMLGSPYTEKTKYFDQEAGEVKTTTYGNIHLNTKSKGAGDQNVAPMTYDKFGNFHPFGTTPNGYDLFTYMVLGARTSIIIGAISILISAFIATTMALVSAYYKGIVDLATVLAADSIISLPQLLLLMMVGVAFQNHWLANPLGGGLLLALIFGFSGWPGLWRTMRGPALQVSEEEWIDAAKSFGQTVPTTMRKHMLPYILGYLLIYGSMILGGIMISTSALSFLGLGIDQGTAEWGRAINSGQDYVGTQSWHTSLIPGLMIVIVVTGLNAFGDGIRDAIDPQSEGGGSDEAAAGGAAG